MTTTVSSVTKKKEKQKSTTDVGACFTPDFRDKVEEINSIYYSQSYISTTGLSLLSIIRHYNNVSEIIRAVPWVFPKSSEHFKLLDVGSDNVCSAQ